MPRYEGLSPASARASRIARTVSRSDTRAEVALRRALWALGFRYRKHVRHLPGCPDLAFRKARVAVFCDGDFWHGRNWNARRRKLKAGANAPYWVAKIHANRMRDRRVTNALRSQGWTVVRLWETDILRDPHAAAQFVVAAIEARPSSAADS